MMKKDEHWTTTSHGGKLLGDDWKVQCSSSSTKRWLREEPVQFVHVDTKYYLSSSAQHKYGQPIPGQLEVAAAKSSSKNTKWMAQVTQEYGYNGNGCIIDYSKTFYVCVLCVCVNRRASILQPNEEGVFFYGLFIYFKRWLQLCPIQGACSCRHGLHPMAA